MLTKAEEQRRKEKKRGSEYDPRGRDISGCLTNEHLHRVSGTGRRDLQSDSCGTGRGGDPPALLRQDLTVTHGPYSRPSSIFSLSGPFG